MWAGQGNFLSEEEEYLTEEEASAFYSDSVRNVLQLLT